MEGVRKEERMRFSFCDFLKIVSFLLFLSLRFLQLVSWFRWLSWWRICCIRLYQSYKLGRSGHTDTDITSYQWSVNSNQTYYFAGKFLSENSRTLPSFRSCLNCARLSPSMTVRNSPSLALKTRSPGTSGHWRAGRIWWAGLVWGPGRENISILQVLNQTTTEWRVESGRYWQGPLKHNLNLTNHLYPCLPTYHQP